MFEDGFSEEDAAFDPVRRETEEELEARAKSACETIFDEEWDAEEDRDGSEEESSALLIALAFLMYPYSNDRFLPVISITSHSGFIRCFCKAVNHPPYALPTGG